MNNSNHKLLALFSFFIFLSCCEVTQNNQRSHVFKSYMKEIFPEYNMEDGEYLVILPRGCSNCIQSTMAIIFDYPSILQDRYRAIIISKSTKSSFPKNISNLDEMILCDNTNKLDRLSLGIFGISVLKIEKGNIIASKSMMVEDFEKGILAFFTDPL